MIQFGMKSFQKRCMNWFPKKLLTIDLSTWRALILKCTKSLAKTVTSRSNYLKLEFLFLILVCLRVTNCLNVLGRIQRTKIITMKAESLCALHASVIPSSTKLSILSLSSFKLSVPFTCLFTVTFIWTFLGARMHSRTRVVCPDRHEESSWWTATTAWRCVP